MVVQRWSILKEEDWRSEELATWYAYLDGTANSILQARNEELDVRGRHSEIAGDGFTISLSSWTWIAFVIRHFCWRVMYFMESWLSVRSAAGSASGQWWTSKKRIWEHIINLENKTYWMNDFDVIEVDDKWFGMLNANRMGRVCWC